MKELLVFISGTLAGSLIEDSNGEHRFSYDPSYVGPALSWSMPVDGKEFRHRQVDPFLSGLLPDSQELRAERGHSLGISGSNPFSLLTHMGLDCPGAVQICAEEDAHLVHERDEDLVELSDEQIAERLRPDSGREIDAWYRDEDERWSLGGNQSKFALRLKDGAWFECHGAAATTHIFKPGVEGMRLEALDEFVCMRVARLCSVPCEEVDYQLFRDVPALIATRYDRRLSGDAVHRVHQEDFCQALSVMPERKYAEDGGPSTPDILRVLHTLSEARESVEAFTAMLFLNYVLVAPDAHAKNYSILHLPDGRTTLAPLYDVASVLPYDRRAEAERGRHPVRLAMSIGGENRAGFLQRKHIERYARMAGLDSQWCVDLMGRLCVAAVEASRQVFRELEGTPGSDLLQERLAPRLTAHARQTVAALE